MDDWQVHMFNIGRVDDFLTQYSLVSATRLGVTAALLAYLWQRDSSVELSVFCCYPEKAVQQIIELLVIWEAMMLM